MNRTMTDLRGYTVREPEQASTKSKLLAAAAVILGVAAIGAYAYTSQSLLPSAPVSQMNFSNQPVPLTPPAQPAMTLPEAATPAPQATPQVQAPAPEINAPAPQAAVRPKPAQHIAHVKARTPETQQPVSTPTVTQQDTTQTPAIPSQTVTPNTATPSTDTTTPYTSAPATTTPQNATPQSTAPDSATPQPQPTPDQSAPQTPQ